MVDEEGVAMDFLLGELVVNTNDEAKLNAFLGRWGGTVVYKIDAIGDVAPVYRIKLDPSAAQVESLLGELNQKLPDLSSKLTTSSEEAAKLLAVAFTEMHREGISIFPNFVATPADIASATTTEAPSSPDERYTPNAFDWTYMNQGSPQDIGVGEAWQLLQRGGRFSNRVPIMIIDGGFVPNADFPANRRIIGTDWSVPNPANCGGAPCPWHGTHVVTSAMGRPDNNFGVAGPAGPVAELVAVQFSLNFFNIIRTLGETVQAVPEVKIINISASIEISTAVRALKAVFGVPDAVLIAEGVASAVSASGKLIFAAAGNEGRNVDERGRAGLVEKSTTLPCELSAVICVGGMEHNSTARAPGSNYGSSFGNNTVDIYGPYWVWIGPDPDNTDNVAQRLGSGTSYASPFVAGVAALVWAADPSLTASQVWEIMGETAHIGGVGGNGHQRRINAFRAVARVLGGEPPTVTLSASPGASPLNREWSVTATVNDPEYGSAPCPPVACPLSWNPEPTRIVGNTAFYRFTTLGNQTVTVTAEDLVGQTTSASRTVDVVNSAPVVAISQPTAGASFFVGQTVQLLGSATDLNEGPDPGPGPITCNWSSSNASDTAFPRTGCNTEVTFASAGSRTLTLSSTDPQGLSSSATVTITINPAPANLPPVITLGSLSPAVNYNGDGYSWETTLSATASATDPEGDTPITYIWRATSFRPNSTIVWRSDVVLSTSTTSGNLSWTPSSNNPDSLLGDFANLGNDCYSGQVIRLTLEARDSDLPAGNPSFRTLPDIKVYRCQVI